MNVYLISVVRDFAMYARCIADNENCRGCERVTIDNREHNESICVCYNRFIDSLEPDEEAWLVFCHEDFEFLEPIAARLSDLSTEAIWGPIGASTKVRFGIFHQFTLVGTVRESRKDGSNLYITGNRVPQGTPVETFDCQCLIAHSSLIRKHHLRFDEKLSFDLYTEDFCIAAHENAKITSRILPFSARHWSMGNIQARYYQQEAYLNKKYPNVCYTGTSSWILGGNPPLFRRLTVAAKMTYLGRQIRRVGRFIERQRRKRQKL